MNKTAYWIEQHDTATYYVMKFDGNHHTCLREFRSQREATRYLETKIKGQSFMPVSPNDRIVPRGLDYSGSVNAIYVKI